MTAAYTANLCVIATGKYHAFLGPLLDSASNFFAVDHSPAFHIFTDCIDHPFWRRRPSEHEAPLYVHPVEHEPWPGPTLHRYRTMLAAADSLRARTHTFYIDADMLFTAPVCDEIFGDLIATIHPGFVNAPPATLPHEQRMESAAFVGWRDRRRYYCGGFQGGRTERWLEAMAVMDAMIRRDETRGIIPTWHDESVWNAYLSRNPPTWELSPLYCTLQEHATRGGPHKILALKKNHKEFRSC